MIAGIGLEQIDHILDQLESLSLAAPSKREFYEAALSRLQTLLNAQCVTYLVPVAVGSQIESKHWSPLAAVGDLQASQEANALCSQINSESSWTLSTDHQSLLVLANTKTGQPSGIIAARLTIPVDSAAAKDLVHLMRAFGEIIDLRNHREKELFFRVQFPRFQKSLSVLAQSTDLQQASMIVAHELQEVVSADRVSLVHFGSRQSPHLLAVSGVSGKILPTEAATEILRVCSEAQRAGKPFLQTPNSVSSPQPSDRNPVTVLSPCLAAFPLNAIPYQRDQTDPTQSETLGNIDQTHVLFEWSDSEKFMAGLSVMSNILPTLAPLWHTQSRWLRQSSVSRWLGSSSYSIKLAWNRWIVRTAVAAVALAVAAWLLARPVEFRIEMHGVLEPIAQKTIYAAHDGYIDQLLVDDNSPVLQGQQVAVMRSPELELQIQEVRGQLRANDEKRNALSLSLNQINDSQSADSQSKQQTVGSELRQVDIQRQNLEQRLEALVGESEKLKLTAPISGVVVSREIARTLESRPIRRGDAVVRVADPTANWRLALRIKDSDIGHVKQQLSLSNSTSAGKDSLEFVLVSNPTTEYQAKLSWLANNTRNPDGQGVIVDAHADVEQSIEAAQIGATVQAYIKCDQRPLWYVWSRPLWETIQRKLWF